MHTLNETGLAQTTKPHQKVLTTPHIQKGANIPQTFLRSIHLMCNPDVDAVSPIQANLIQRNNPVRRYCNSSRLDRELGDSSPFSPPPDVVPQIFSRQNSKDEEKKKREKVNDIPSKLPSVKELASKFLLKKSPEPAPRTTVKVTNTMSALKRHSSLP